MPSTVVGIWIDVDAAQPGGGDEAGEVGRRAAAEADDGVGAGEVGLPHDLPAERGDLDALGALGVRDLGEQHLVPLGELLAQRLRPRAEGRRVHDEHLGDLRCRGASATSPSSPRPTSTS